MVSKAVSEDCRACGSVRVTLMMRYHCQWQFRWNEQGVKLCCGRCSCLKATCSLKTDPSSITIQSRNEASVRSGTACQLSCLTAAVPVGLLVGLHTSILHLVAVLPAAGCGASAHRPALGAVGEFVCCLCKFVHTQLGRAIIC